MSYIYLCTNNNYNKYKCKSFNNFIEANKYYNENYKNNWSSMISINIFIPLFLHKYILQYKLAKLFINVNIDNY